MINIKEVKNISIKYEAKAIADLLIAFRKTYQNIFIKNHVKLNKTSIDFLPVKTTNDIAKVFSDINTRITIKTVSSRPRNPDNMANKYQLKAIKYFEKTKSKESIFDNIGNNQYHYIQPLYVTKLCMKCHGKKEDAPKIIKERYNKAYDYKIGDLRGIMDISIHQTKFGKLLDTNQNIRLLYTVVFIFITLSLAFLYTRRIKKQDSAIFKLQQILARSNRNLRKNRKDTQIINKNLELKVQEALIELRNKDKQMLHQSRLAQMGEMISMIAHQWRQPLSAISGTSSALALKSKLNKLDKDTTIELADKITSYSHHLSSTIDDFREFFKTNKEKRDTTFKDLIDEVLKIIEISIDNKNIELIVDTMSDRNLHTYPNEVKQVILNLIKNAEDILIENNITNGQITIKSNRKILEISDNGGGIPEEIISKIFDPYFSTKIKKDGTGLGLYMSKIIIEEHCGGTLSVSNDEKGAVFKIDLNKA
jgi:signal transduction histidine kinase